MVKGFLRTLGKVFALALGSMLAYCVLEDFDEGSLINLVHIVDMKHLRAPILQA